MSIPYNTIQKVRRFLTALEVPPSAFADSDEVLSLLTESIRRRRGDPAIREKFFELIEELQDRSSTDLAGLSAPIDESIDASALAQELELVWTEQPVAGPFVHQRMLAAILVLALLLVGLALNMSCTSSDDDTDDQTACIEDTSADHFADMIGQNGDLTTAQRQEAIDDYDGLSADEQEEVIADLCGMPADQIAAYLEDMFSLPGDDDSLPPDDDANTDDDTTPGDDDTGYVLYKGVAF